MVDSHNCQRPHRIPPQSAVHQGRLKVWQYIFVPDRCESGQLFVKGSVNHGCTVGSIFCFSFVKKWLTAQDQSCVKVQYVRF